MLFLQDYAKPSYRIISFETICNNTDRNILSWVYRRFLLSQGTWNKVLRKATSLDSAIQRQQRNRRERVFHRITIPTGLSLERETSPLAGPTNNPISELRLAASDEPLSDYRRSRIDRLWWHTTEWRRRRNRSFSARKCSLVARRYNRDRYNRDRYSRIVSPRWRMIFFSLSLHRWFVHSTTIISHRWNFCSR